MNQHKEVLIKSCLALLSLAMFVVLCLMFGAHNQAKVSAHIAEDKQEAGKALDYGHPAPDINISFLSGSTARLSSYRGHWTVLIFADPQCDSCFKEMDSIQTILPDTQNNLSVIPIMEAQSYIVPKSMAAQTLSAQHHYPFPIAYDDGSEAKLFGCASSFPFAVLLDPAGQCRLTMQGYSPTPHKSQLACAIKSYFAGRFYNCLPVTRWSRFTPSADVTFDINGKPTKLSTLSQNKIVMVTLFTGNTAFEAERVRVIESYQKAPNMTFLCVGKGPNDIPQELQGANVLRVEGNTKPVFDAFAEYRPDPGPVSVLVYRLSRFASERGAASEADAFEHAIGYTAFLSESPFLPMGFPVAKQTQVGLVPG